MRYNNLRKWAGCFANGGRAKVLCGRCGMFAECGEIEAAASNALIELLRRETAIAEDRLKAEV